MNTYYVYGWFEPKNYWEMPYDCAVVVEARDESAAEDLGETLIAIKVGRCNVIVAERAV